MVSLPFAFSVHKFVDSVGADAGFAAIIGLALLVLLFFAQSRETSSLRDRLADSGEKIDGLESRIAQILRLQQSRPVAPPVGVTPAAGRPGAAQAGVRTGPAAGTPGAANGSGGVAPGALLGAPAGVAAPALGSATTMIPAPEPRAGGDAVDDTMVVVPSAPGARDFVPPPVAPPAAAPVASGASDSTSEEVPAGVTAAAAGAELYRPSVVGPPGAGADENDEVDEVDEDDDEPIAAPAPLSRPSTAAGAATAQGRGSTAPARGTASSPGAAAPRGPVSSRATASSRADAPTAGTTGRAGAREQPGGAPPRRTIPTAAQPAGNAWLRRVLPAVAAILVIAVIVIVLLSVTGGSPSSTAVVHQTSPSTSSSSRGQRHRTAFDPARVDVAVLNGTATNGLAADVAAKLSHAGYRVPQATIANAATQTQTTTVVGYQSGGRTDAEHVAKALNLAASAVQPAAQPAVQICASPPATGTSTTTSNGTCGAQVIVTVGSDLANLASSTTTSP